MKPTISNCAIILVVSLFAVSTSVVAQSDRQLNVETVDWNDQSENSTSALPTDGQSEVVQIEKQNSSKVLINSSAVASDSQSPSNSSPRDLKGESRVFEDAKARKAELEKRAKSQTINDQPVDQVRIKERNIRIQELKAKSELNTSSKSMGEEERERTRQERENRASINQSTPK